jgi:hypothetical protein
VTREQFVDTSLLCGDSFDQEHRQLIERHLNASNGLVWSTAAHIRLKEHVEGSLSCVRSRVGVMPPIAAVVGLLLVGRASGLLLVGQAYGLLLVGHASAAVRLG